MKVLQVIMTQEIYKGVTTYVTDLRNSLSKYINIDICLRKEFDDLVQKNRLIEKARQYDLVDIHSTYPFYSIRLARIIGKLKVPICINFSLTTLDYCKYYLEMNDFDLGYWRFKGLISSRLDRTTVLISWSQKAKENLISQYFVSPEKVLVVYPFIRVSEKGRKNNSDGDNSVTIGFISGHEFYRKNDFLALKAFELLCGEYKNINLHMVTDLKLKGSTNIKISPLMSRNELYNFFYPDCDILVVPSQIESFGMVLLEAMSFGIPVVTTDIYASREIIEDGENGFLIRKNSLEDLVQKLKILLDNPTLRLKMGQRARRIVESKFNEKNCHKILEIYNMCIKSHIAKD